jgi:hypothetical protein
VYMCICVYVYMCICVYVYMCICAYVYIYMYICICTHVYMCICNYTQQKRHTCTLHMYTCVYYTCIHVHICIYTYIYVYIYTYTQIHIYTYTHIHYTCCKCVQQKRHTYTLRTPPATPKRAQCTHNKQDLLVQRRPMIQRMHVRAWRAHEQRSMDARVQCGNAACTESECVRAYSYVSASARTWCGIPEDQPRGLPSSQSCQPQRPLSIAHRMRGCA